MIHFQNWSWILALFDHFWPFLANLEAQFGNSSFPFNLFFLLYSQNDVHYEAFDFHKECSKMRYDRLVLLKDQLAKYSFGYFHKIGSAVGSNQVRFHAKVQIFWEGHKILKIILQLTLLRFFSNFCGLLRIYELYDWQNLL